VTAQVGLLACERTHFGRVPLDAPTGGPFLYLGKSLAEDVTPLPAQLRQRSRSPRQTPYVDSRSSPHHMERIVGVGWTGADDVGARRGASAGPGPIDDAVHSGLDLAQRIWITDADHLRERIDSIRATAGTQTASVKSNANTADICTAWNCRGKHHG